LSLRPLSAYDAGPYRPRRTAIAALLVASAVYVGSMPLHWVAVISPTGTYEIVDGLQQANWILVGTVAIVAVAVALVRAPPGGFIRFSLVALDFAFTLGMYIEYIDNLGRADSLTVKPYLGPGFFLALGATALLIGASVVAWREPSG